MVRPSTAAEILIVSTTPHAVGAINTILARGGEPVHCTWLASAGHLAQHLAHVEPQLLVHVGVEREMLQPVIEARNRIAVTVPLVVVSDRPLDEDQIADVMRLGARDAVSLASPAHVHSVMRRELLTFRLARALHASAQSAIEARRQLEAAAPVKGNGLVPANRPRLQWTPGMDSGSIDGSPVRGLLHGPAQPGALAPWRRPRPEGATLALMADPGNRGARPAMRLVAQGAHPVVVQPAGRQALLPRSELLQALAARLGSSTDKALGLALLAIEPFEALERALGALATEQVIIELAGLVAQTLLPPEILGRLDSGQLLVVLERDDAIQLTAWAGEMRSRIRAPVSPLARHALAARCVFGLAAVGPGMTLDAALARVRERSRPEEDHPQPVRVRPQPAAQAASSRTEDEAWSEQVRAALRENRFRLLRQRIESLAGAETPLFDVRLRMLDAHGMQILPSRFLAAAERHGLLASIDRWVVATSLSLTAEHRPGCLLVRLSRVSACDGRFIEWLDEHLSLRPVQPGQLCFQIPEGLAASHFEQVCSLSEALHERGLRFALEGFGSSDHSQRLLDSVPLDFVKIDRTLIQGLAADPQLQQRVRTLVDAASQREVRTIGEQVRGASVTALLKEARMHYVQAYWLH